MGVSQKNGVEKFPPPVSFENYCRRLLFIFLACYLLALAQTTQAQDTLYVETLNNLSTLSRIAPTYNLSEFDPNHDGILELAGIQSGDIIFRPHDGVTQVEEGEYVVPNNQVYVDHDGDNILDPEPLLAKLVVVTRDNLTYLFAENSHEVIGIFPNGTGRGGANTAPSIRVVDAFLGSEWGANESARRGFSSNAFGAITLGTSYYLNDSTTIPTAQEVHGTPDNWQSLLGTEVSGGCTRHRNQDIAVIRQNMEYGDIIVTMETPQDDSVDNALTLYNTTRLAAGMAPIPLTAYPDITNSLLAKPQNYDALSTLNPLDTPRWVNFDQLPLLPIPEIIAHPYTRAEYKVIPCGSENMYLSDRMTGHDRLIPTANGYQLEVAPNITLPDGSLLNTSDFYQPTEVTPQDVIPQLYRFSAGEHIAYYQYLVMDYSFQYAVFVAARDFHQPQLLQADRTLQGEAILRLSSAQLREVQLVTGLLPLKYSWVQSITQTPGDFVRGLENRTLIHSMMNIFYGQAGEVYELDFRSEPYGIAYPMQDQTISIPSPDHEMIRDSSQEPAIIYNLLQQALQEKRGVVFRVSQFAAQTTALRYELGLSQAHYYSLVPDASDLQAGYIGIYDTMHPSEILQMRLEHIDDIFTTMTVAPATS